MITSTPAKKNPKAVLQLLIEDLIIDEVELFMQNQNRDNKKAEIDAVIEWWKIEYNLSISFLGYEVVMIVQSSINDYEVGDYKRRLIAELMED